MQLDFEKARANMVESQVRTNDVSDIRLIDAIANTKREIFVHTDSANFAYSEINVISQSGRALLKPRDLSKIAQALNISPNDKVLVIAGSGGYSAAVIGLLSQNVTIIDSLESPLATCTAIIGDLVSLKEIEGNKYDVIFVDQGVETIPNSWFEALSSNGRMGVIEFKGSIGMATLYVNANGYKSSRVLFETQVPKLSEFNRTKEFEF